MKNTKFLRSALILVLALAIIGSVTGGTIAWFTDTVEATNNVIQAGNLDMVVEYYDAETSKWEPVEEDTNIFDEEALYEPGYTEVAYLRIRNAGNLAFKYQLSLSVQDIVIGESVLGTPIYLSDYLQISALEQKYYNFGTFNMFEATKNSTFANRDKALSFMTNSSQTGMIDLSTKNEENLVALTGIGNNMIPSEATDDMLAGEENATFVALLLHMPTTVGNEANHKTGTDAPKTVLGIHAVATQYTYEEDSFDSKYDKDATYPSIEVDDPTTPDASVRPLEGDELKITCTNVVEGYEVADFIDFPVLNGDYTLDFGLEFKADGNLPELAGKDYTRWPVDFELESTKALPDDGESHISLAGHYGFMDLADTGYWIGFDIIGVEVAANDPQRIVGIYDPNLTYEEVESIGTFKCGVIVDKDFFAGETLTLKLCMYEPADEGDPIKHVITTVTKTF